MKNLMLKTSVGFLFILLFFTFKSNAQTGASMPTAIYAGSFGTGGGPTFTDSRNNISYGGTTFTNSMGQSSPEVYYQFVITGNPTMDFSLCGSNFDTYIHILDSGGSIVFSSDDSDDCGTKSHLIYALTAGTYYLAVEGYSSYTGDINLVISTQGGSTATAPIISYPSANVLPLGSPVNILPSNTGGAISAGPVTSTLVGSGLYNPLNTISDGAGNLYIADAGNHQIKKVTPGGVMTVLAGAGYSGYADGTGTAAIFRHPSTLAIDASGNIFVSDQQNHMIRKITPSGVVSTFAGSGSIGSTDGNGMTASFYYPMGLAFDAAGNLYVADAYNHKIRKITPSGVVSTFAGTGSLGSSNSTSLSSTFNYPMGLVFDGSGNLYIADRTNHMIRKISTSGTVSTLAGSGSAGYAEGTGTAAMFNNANSMVVDAAGNLYLADMLNHRIRKITPAGVVTTLAGNGVAGTVNGSGSTVSFNSPYGISKDNSGNLIVATNAANVIRKIVLEGGYTINPALPSGLSLDANTGAITGTPTTSSPATTYTVTASNSAGSHSFSFTIAISENFTPSTSDYNYISTYIPRVPLTNPGAISGSSIQDVNRNVQYMDGLGRVIQTVDVGASPSNKDVVQPVAYDEFGRQAINYQSYTTGTGIAGAFRTNALIGPGGYSASAQFGFYGQTGQNYISTDYPYAQTKYEASPLGRVIEQGAAGSAWQVGSDHTIRTVHTGNHYAGQHDHDITLYEALISTTSGQQHLRTLVQNYTQRYSRLFLTITRDENWTEANGKAGSLYEYKNKEGQIILKRQFNQVGAELQQLSTYYVYDDLGNLCFVLPPGANADNASSNLSQAQLDDYCYQYRYDSRNRLIEKKIPGKGWECLVYNKLDQVVLTQDANQSLQNQWMYAKYDKFGRIISSGAYTSSADRISLQEIIRVDGLANELWESRSSGNDYSNVAFPRTGIDPYVVNYYDDYTFPGGGTYVYNVGSNKIKGLQTGTKVKVLGTTSMLLSLNFFDADGRVIKAFQQHYKGGVANVGNYDEINTSYKFSGEVENSTRKHHVGGVESLYVLNEYTYDHMGRKIDARQRTGDNSNTGNPLILLSRNVYNELGQLLNKSLHSTNLSSPTFAQTVAYGYNERGWMSSQVAGLFSQSLKYNEAIGGVTPQFNGNISRQEWTGGRYYNYVYDNLNRLISGISSDGNNELLGYDVMGNIQSLTRHSNSSLVDQLTYGYAGTGNKLASLTDASGDASPSFQLTGTTNYMYDANGNMTSRTNSTSGGNNISGTTYNHLNLPSSMDANGALIAYTYDAAGNKLKKLVTGIVNVNNEYIGGIHYEGGVLKYLSTEAGRVVRNSATDYSYEYTLTDHLGNGRVFFNITSGGLANKIQETDYYAFGLDIQRYFNGTENKYQYNGKEKQDQEKMLDYGARFYDPVVGRWNVVDPMAEIYDDVSPYNYVLNNPTLMVDPDGMATVSSNEGTDPKPDPKPIQLKEIVIKGQQVMEPVTGFWSSLWYGLNGRTYSKGGLNLSVGLDGKTTGIAPLTGTPPDLSRLSFGSLKSLGKLFSLSKWKSLLGMAKYTFKIAAKEGNLIFYTTKVGDEVIEFGGTVSKADGVLTIKGFDIDGGLTNKLGIKGLKEIMNDFGKSEGVSKVIVEGAKRTTGANPGRLPAKLVFDIK